MDARTIIAKLRQRQSPTADELGWFAQGLADQSISDAQAGAFAMGVCLAGLSTEGRVALTLAMRDSGQTLEWGGLGKPVLDKHSTGGVGDCVSLLLAPALAACGVAVPMISGRGLGHTGGTLDKLESIPGLSTALDEARLRAVVAEAGAAIVGATSDIAPADKRLYAVRDVTATVESLDLITASILSKKLAAGLDGLVLDVKVGTGAFMKTPEQARELAESLVNTANAAGCKTSAVITDMSQPLVSNMGNALEVAAVARVLRDATPGRLLDVSMVLGGVLLADAGLVPDQDAGAALILRAVQSGEAAQAFGRMVAAQGGPMGFMENPARYLPEATVIREVTADRAGILSAIDGEKLGLTVVELGGGRKVESDVVDPAVGISHLAELGSQVAKGDVLGVIHAARPEHADAAERAIRSAMVIGAQDAKRPPLVHEVIS